MNLSLRAVFEQFAAPGYGTCGRCKRPWKFVTGHSTRYSDSEGCFPLCEDCWSELATPQARLPYYMELVGVWLANDSPPAHRLDILNRKWPAICRAVQEGK